MASGLRWDSYVHHSPVAFFAQAVVMNRFAAAAMPAPLPHDRPKREGGARPKGSHKATAQTESSSFASPHPAAVPYHRGAPQPGGTLSSKGLGKVKWGALSSDQVLKMKGIGVRPVGHGASGSSTILSATMPSSSTDPFAGLPGLIDDEGNITHDEPAEHVGAVEPSTITQYTNKVHRKGAPPPYTLQREDHGSELLTQLRMMTL